MRQPGEGREPDDISELVSRRARGSRTLLLVFIVVVVVFVGRQSGLFGPTLDTQALTTVNQAVLEQKIAAAGPLLIEGNPQAGTTIIEFFDYRCAHCRTMAPLIHDLVTDDTDLRVILVEYPILGPESELAARFALAAAKQDGYAVFHRALMYSTVEWTARALADLGQGLGLDGDRLQSDANSPDVTALLAAYRSAAQDDMIDGTPAFIMGDMLIVGAVDETTLRELVRLAREGQNPG